LRSYWFGSSVTNIDFDGIDYVELIRVKNRGHCVLVYV